MYMLRVTQGKNKRLRIILRQGPNVPDFETDCAPSEWCEAAANFAAQHGYEVGHFEADSRGDMNCAVTKSVVVPPAPAKKRPGRAANPETVRALSILISLNVKEHAVLRDGARLAGLPVAVYVRELALAGGLGSPNTSSPKSVTLGHGAKNRIRGVLDL